MVAERIGGPADAVGDGPGVGDVERCRDGAAAGGDDRSHCLLGTVDDEVVHGDRRAPGGERGGDAGAGSPATAGDERGPAVEVEHVDPPVRPSTGGPDADQLRVLDVVKYNAVGRRLQGKDHEPARRRVGGQGAETWVNW